MTEEISLKEYFDTRIEAVEKSTVLAFNAIQKATDLANENLKVRLENMNEFRESLKDQAARFITRDEMIALLKPMNDNINLLRETRSNVEGSKSQLRFDTTTLIAIAGVVIAVISIVFNRL